jgi:toxin-antitoxin system PIN domain toxin
MILPDVSVLVGAFRADAPRHAELLVWLESAVGGPEGFAVSDAVLGGTVRILTHPRVFIAPTPLGTALDLVAQLRSYPDVTVLAPGPHHWEIVDRLCREADARGNLVADAQHAALAIEHGATWISLDRDFARFSALRRRSPLA